MALNKVKIVRSSTPENLEVEINQAIVGLGRASISDIKFAELQHPPTAQAVSRPFLAMIIYLPSNN